MFRAKGNPACSFQVAYPKINGAHPRRALQARLADGDGEEVGVDARVQVQDLQHLRVRLRLIRRTNFVIALLWSSATWICASKVRADQQDCAHTGASEPVTSIRGNP